MSQIETQSSSVKRLIGNQQFLLLLVWFAMIGIFTAFNSIFFSTAVFGNILLDWAPVVLMAVGQTFVIISGGIDLSVGSTVGLSGVVAAFQMQKMMTNGDNQWTIIIVGTVVAAARPWLAPRPWSAAGSAPDRAFGACRTACRPRAGAAAA